MAAGRPPALTLGHGLAEVVHQDLAHDPGRDREEVLPVVGADGPPIEHLEGRLAHDLGRAQHPAPTLRELRAGEAPQLAVDDLIEPVPCLDVAVRRGPEISV